MWDAEKKEKTLCSSPLPRVAAFSRQSHQCSSWRQISVATKKTFALLSPCTATARMTFHMGQGTLAGSSGWAGTKREAPLMCLCVFTGVQVGNLPILDTPLGAGAAELSTLDTENTLLNWQQVFLLHLSSTAKSSSRDWDPMQLKMPSQGGL